MAETDDNEAQGAGSDPTSASSGRGRGKAKPASTASTDQHPAGQRVSDDASTGTGDTPPPAPAEEAPEPEAPEEVEYTLTRLLDPSEGPEILRREWHEIIGAFGPEIEAIKRDPSVADRTLPKSKALAQIEEWLQHEVEFNNRVEA